MTYLYTRYAPSRVQSIFRFLLWREFLYIQLYSSPQQLDLTFESLFWNRIFRNISQILIPCETHVLCSYIWIALQISWTKLDLSFNSQEKANTHIHIHSYIYTHRDIYTWAEDISKVIFLQWLLYESGTINLCITILIL